MCAFSRPSWSRTSPTCSRASPMADIPDIRVVAQSTKPTLGEWDAGADIEVPQPRGWLLGNVFCRRFVSSLIADGGVGKTTLRTVQLLSLAIGRSLTGEHVFQRC